MRGPIQLMLFTRCIEFTLQFHPSSSIIIIKNCPICAAYCAHYTLRSGPDGSEDLWLSVLALSNEKKNCQLQIGLAKIYDLFFLQDRKCRIILGGSFLILMAMRFYLSGFRVLPQFAPADNPTARSPLWITRTLTFLYLPVSIKF